MRAQDFVKTNVAYHETLNHQAWDNGVLRPEVRERLLEIAEFFIEYLEVPDFDVHDIVLTGSLANYNYTEARYTPCTGPMVFGPLHEADCANCEFNSDAYCDKDSGRCCLGTPWRSIC